MRRSAWWLGILLLVGLSALFPPMLTAKEKVTITVYHRDELPEVEWLKQVEKEFEKLNPDIDVKLVAGVGGGGASYAERLTVLWASGSPPDVFYGSADKVGFILNGWVRDLTDLIARDKEELDPDDFFSGLLNSWTRQGRNLGIPAIAMGTSLFYNKDMFAEAGLPDLPIDWNDKSWTWDSFVTAAVKLTRFDGQGRIIRAGVNGVPGVLVASQDAIDGQLGWMWGGDLFPKEAYETGIAKEISLVNDAVLTALTKTKELYADKRAAAVSPNSMVGYWTGFAEGKIAMQWVSWWWLRDFLRVKPNFKWGIATVPLARSRVQGRYTDPWFVSSASKHPEEAWRFVKYVTGKDGQKSYAEFVKFPPSRRSVFPVYLQGVVQATGMSVRDALLTFEGALQNSRPALDEVIGGASVWGPIAAQILTPALLGQKDIRAAAEQAENSCNSVLKKLAAEWDRRQK